MAASSRSERNRPSARSQIVAQIVLAIVSMTAPPTTHVASSASRVDVASSASRPATREPSDIAIAPTSDIEKQNHDSGRLTRRQSTGTRPAGRSPEEALAGGAGREVSMRVTMSSG